MTFIHFWGHDRFRLGDHAVFSQWYKSPMHYDGIMFPSAEHWMMYQKAVLFDDDRIADKILNEPKQGVVKNLGRKVKGFDEKIWDDAKLDIVRFGTLLKFTQSLELERILLDTADAVLVEASPYDSIWGIGMMGNHPDANNPDKWQGENLLGFVLMDVRSVLLGDSPTKL